MYAYAKPQWWITTEGCQYAEGYDDASVIAKARTLDALRRKAGSWWGCNGYSVYDYKSGLEVSFMENPNTGKLVEVDAA